MLVLNRTAGTKIMIGDNVVVTVIGVSGGQVRVGIEAPKHVEVHREEIYNKIKSQKNTESIGNC